MRWRIILTDSEGPTGVAPVCGFEGHQEDTVLDCCPQPHLECWGDKQAKDLKTLLNNIEAEPCP